MQIQINSYQDDEIEHLRLFRRNSRVNLHYSSHSHFNVSNCVSITSWICNLIIYSKWNCFANSNFILDISILCSSYIKYFSL